MNNYHSKIKSEYIIVTPMKNEIDNLEKLIYSVVGKHIKPKLWVVCKRQ